MIDSDPKILADICSPIGTLPVLAVSPFITKNPEMTKIIMKQGEMLCTTTIRIEATNSKGEGVTGTGFYYSISGEGDNYIPMVITNKHVIEGMDDIVIVVTKADVDGNRINEHIKYNIRDVHAAVVNHPDQEVDLCAISLFPILKDLRSDGIEIHCHYIDNKIIPGESDFEKLDAIEEILMIGYPDGLWDEKNNMPIVRSGITATSPRLDYNGEKEFLVDMACFPGSSGSPIFYLNKSYKTDMPGGILGHKISLLGILYAGPLSLVEGDVENKNGIFAKSYTSIPINLGCVIKANRLLELEVEVKKKVQNGSIVSSSEE